MPGGDRTGPWGEGPMTGRAAGYCAGFLTAGFPTAGFPTAGYRGFRPGFGSGWGGGWGRGWRHRAYRTGWSRWGRWFAPAWGGPQAYGPLAPPTREQEADMLASQAEWLQAQLDEINQRLAELEPTE